MSAPATSNSALIACFICQRRPAEGNERPDDFKRLLEQFAPDPVPKSTREAASSVPRTSLVERDLAGDVVCFVLAMNALSAGQRADVAWDELRAQLSANLPEARLRKLVGYTLIYQADVDLGYTPAQAYNRVARHARAIHAAALSDGGGLPIPLAAHAEPAGELWLMQTPRRDLTDRATVYLALGPADRADELVTQRLLSNQHLLYPDLLAHKAYYHIRQYRAPLDGPQSETPIDRYNRELADLRGQARRLREAAELGTPPTTDLSGAIERYNRLIEAFLHFDGLRVALSLQRHNHCAALAAADLGEIGQHHQRAIDDAHDELIILVDEGTRPLEAARAAIEIVRATLERDNQRQQAQAAHGQQVAGLLIATAAAGLTIAQVVNLQVVAALAMPRGIASVTTTDLNDLSPGTILRLFLLQFALVLLLVLAIVAFAYGVLFIWRRWRRGRAAIPPIPHRAKSASGADVVIQAVSRK